MYAKEEAARLRDGGVRDGLRRNAGVRGRAADLLEYEKDPCAKCQSKCRSVSEPGPGGRRSSRHQACVRTSEHSRAATCTGDAVNTIECD